MERRQGGFNRRSMDGFGSIPDQPSDRSTVLTEQSVPELSDPAIARDGAEDPDQPGCTVVRQPEGLLHRCAAGVDDVSDQQMRTSLPVVRQSLDVIGLEIRKAHQIYRPVLCQPQRRPRADPAVVVIDEDRGLTAHGIGVRWDRTYVLLVRSGSILETSERAILP